MRRLGGEPREGSSEYRPVLDRSRVLFVTLLTALALGVGAGGGVEWGRLHGTPPSLVREPQTGEAVGPRTVVDGMPVGYADTRAGAAEAARDYLTSLGELVQPAAVAPALAVIADPSARSQLVAGTTAGLNVEEGLWGTQSAAASGRQVILTQTPIAYRIDQYTGRQATVRIWLVTTVGVSDQQPLTAFFGIGSATLVWLSGDWKLHAIDDGTVSTDVVPRCLQSPTTTGGIPPMLDGFEPYGR